MAPTNSAGPFHLAAQEDAEGWHRVAIDFDGVPVIAGRFQQSATLAGDFGALAFCSSNSGVSCVVALRGFPAVALTQ